MADPLRPKQLAASALSQHNMQILRKGIKLSSPWLSEQIQCSAGRIFFVLLADKNGAVVTLSR